MVEVRARPSCPVPVEFHPNSIRVPADVHRKPIRVPAPPHQRKNRPPTIGGRRRKTRLHKVTQPRLRASPGRAMGRGGVGASPGNRIPPPLSVNYAPRFFHWLTCQAFTMSFSSFEWPT